MSKMPDEIEKEILKKDGTIMVIGSVIAMALVAL